MTRPNALRTAGDAFTVVSALPPRARPERMEHRLSPRWEIERDVRVHFQGELVAVVRSLNLSREGLFLAMTDALFQRGAFVEVQIAEADGSWRQPRCGALIVHRSSRGVGLMLV